MCFSQQKSISAKISAIGWALALYSNVIFAHHINEYIATLSRKWDENEISWFWNVVSMLQLNTVCGVSRPFHVEDTESQNLLSPDPAEWVLSCSSASVPQPVSRQLTTSYLCSCRTDTGPGGCPAPSVWTPEEMPADTWDSSAADPLPPVPLCPSDYCGHLLWSLSSTPVSQRCGRTVVHCSGRTKVSPGGQVYAGHAQGRPWVDLDSSEQIRKVQEKGALLQGPTHVLQGQSLVWV